MAAPSGRSGTATISAVLYLLAANFEKITAIKLDRAYLLAFYAVFSHTAYFNLLFSVASACNFDAHTVESTADIVH